MSIYTDDGHILLGKMVAILKWLGPRALLNRSMCVMTSDPHMNVASIRVYLADVSDQPPEVWIM